MVDSEKVRLMTQIALCEKKEKKKALMHKKYYKRDYIRFRLIKAFILATIIYMMIVAAWVLYNSESFLLQMDYDLLFNMLQKVCTYYVIFILGFLICTYFTSWISYIKSSKIIKKYQEDIKLLNDWYVKNIEHKESEKYD